MPSQHFNSRPSARGDIRPDQKNPAASRFQFTPLREGRRTGRADSPPAPHFNSRPSARGDHRFDGNGRAAERFQFTPLREGRRRIRAESLSGGHFNSRPSARGDAFSSAARKGMILISIHAPPRGATGQRQKGFSSRSHFNSRPSARGDDAADKGGMLALQFQFTPLREGRLAGGVDKISKNEISIHAPPRGATSPPRWTPWPPTYFNSRPSARGDSQQQRAPQPLRKFQFTPLREGRRRLSSADGSSDDISIHAPPRGATPHDRHLLHLMAISIHAPPRGATHHQGKRSNYSNISIHAPPRGATTPSIRKSPLELFQFTPLREGRHTQPPPLLIHQNISIHAPPRGATRRARCMGTMYLFQFTPLREGRLESACIFLRPAAFQFTPLREGRRRCKILI